MGMIGCPQCSYEPYDPHAPCPNCGTPTSEPGVGAVVTPEAASKPGVVLRLVPPVETSNEARRAACRRILLEALQRIEAGDIEELVLLTVNVRQATSPYTLRWHFVDPIRMSGLLHYAAQHLSGPPYVHMT